jgi:hypothetical protein
MFILLEIVKSFETNCISHGGTVGKSHPAARPRLLRVKGVVASAAALALHAKHNALARKFQVVEKKILNLLPLRRRMNKPNGEPALLVGHS